MSKRWSSGLVVVGVLFLLNAVCGRYLVLPGYLENLEAGAGTLAGAVETVSGWMVARYLLWAYSFKLGIYFLILAAALRTGTGAGRRWVIGVVGFVYIGFAYIPLPEPTSLVFGITGGLMTVLLVYGVFRWAEARGRLAEPERTASDYRMAGYFFFGMATYTLCPLLGVKAFALQPEKMLAYGLQGEAASFAFHLLIELALGWLFTGLSFRRRGA